MIVEHIFKYFFSNWKFSVQISKTMLFERLDILLW